jgi:hypothetical protein
MPRLNHDHAVDLLALTRSRLGVVPSEWERSKTGITSPGTGICKIQIPYSPPETYEFVAELRRLDDSGTIGILVPAKGGVWQLWYHEVNRMNMLGKPNIVPQIILKSEEKFTLSMKVNGQHIDALMNGNVLMSTDKAVQAPEWTLHNGATLGFGTKNCRVEFLSLKIIETSGQGTILK